MKLQNGDSVEQAGTALELSPNFDYGSRDVLDLEKTRLWPKVWQMACRVEQIPKVGDFVNYQIFDESILVTRTAPDRIQAFYNACQHRGRRLQMAESGHVSRWYCPFHGWRYQLDGAIEYVHDEHDWEGCPLKHEALSLKEVRAELWGGWVWINQDPDCEPLHAYLDAVKPVLDPFEWEDGRMAWHETIIAPVNWKVVIEAFNENYHVSATHVGGWRIPPGHSRGVVHGRHAMFFNQRNRVASTSKPLRFQDRHTGEWMTPSTPAEAIWCYNRHVFDNLAALTAEPLMKAAERLKEEAGADFPPERLLPRLMELHKEEFAKRGIKWPERLDQAAIDRAGTDWHIFPNTIMLPTADSALWYRVRPNGHDPESCIFDIWSFARYAPGTEPAVTRHVSDGFDAFRGRNPFLEEDFDNMQAVNLGRKSRGFLGPQLNPVQEVQIAHFHKMLSRYFNGDTSSPG
ncbi:aromatic ring-hydroxylating oxygenase subunit alpha [Sphingomonas flavalba]|uniref:aromatic ring-hydroxylating oxygenase subunit alpha n=1 Tax=Sphingomonas flavalba TaxID=2559804 RepID=UPI0039E188DB